MFFLVQSEYVPGDRSINLLDERSRLREVGPQSPESHGSDKSLRLMALRVMLARSHDRNKVRDRTVTTVRVRI